MIRTMPFFVLFACAFHLVSIACFADASKHNLPDCQMVIPTKTIGDYTRGRLYDEVVAVMKKDTMASFTSHK
ncbi:hypothetical protein Y032_0031g2250 [Ancylostoma ceylanicum]|nr:hypothetical protein Y032_0031g2250 [Ancylostoma ceylanicum]